MEDVLEQERKLSQFRLERWENAEIRLEAVWNEAIDAAATAVGCHRPAHVKMDGCDLCNTYAAIVALKRFERAGYVPVQERIDAVAQRLMNNEEERNWAFESGVRAMANAAKNLFGRKE